MFAVLRVVLLFGGLIAATGSAVASVAAEPGEAEHTDRAGESRVLRLESGYDALLLRIHLIRGARRSIEIQTFIWTNDECGRLMMWELLEAARRGVKVRIVADQMFSETDPATVAFVATAHPNLEVRHYRPAFDRIDPALWHRALAGVLSFRAINQRMHNKVLLVDRELLVIGGRNIENSYFDHGAAYNYRDRDVLVSGPAVAVAAETFERFWNYRHAVPSRALKDVAREIERGAFPRYERREDWDFGSHFGELLALAADDAAMRERFLARMRTVRSARFISDEPGKARGWLKRSAPRGTAELRAALESGREDILVQTPYLVLSPAAREVVQRLREARPGLRIRVSTNSFASTDNLLAYSANYRLRNLYVEQLGLEVHELKPRPEVMEDLFPRHAEIERLTAPERKGARAPYFSLHAKSMVVDRAVAFVGSYNLDPRSENLNCECGVLVEDEDFARDLRAEIERDLRPENSWVIARRDLPLGLDSLNGLVGGLLSLSPVDVWPIRNTSSFDLRPGAAEVPPGHPDFHRNYREVGSFPGADGWISQSEIVTRLYKAVGAPLTPIL